MNYSRRVAIWLLALSVQIIQACAYCGRLEMISVWLLFLRLLVGMKILKLCASVASVSALANVCMRKARRGNDAGIRCAAFVLLCAVYLKRVVMLRCLHPTFRDCLVSACSVSAAVIQKKHSDFSLIKVTSVSFTREKLDLKG